MMAEERKKAAEEKKGSNDSRKKALELALQQIEKISARVR